MVQWSLDVSKFAETVVAGIFPKVLKPSLLKRRQARAPRKREARKRAWSAGEKKGDRAIAREHELKRARAAACPALLSVMSLPVRSQRRTGLHSWTTPKALGPGAYLGVTEVSVKPGCVGSRSPL